MKGSLGGPRSIVRVRANDTDTPTSSPFRDPLPVKARCLVEWGFRQIVVCVARSLHEGVSRDRDRRVRLPMSIPLGRGFESPAVAESEADGSSTRGGFHPDIAAALSACSASRRRRGTPGDPLLIAGGYEPRPADDRAGQEDCAYRRGKTDDGEESDRGRAPARNRGRRACWGRRAGLAKRSGPPCRHGWAPRPGVRAAR